MSATRAGRICTSCRDDLFEGLMTVHGRICRGDVYCDFGLICPSHFYNKLERFSCVQIWQMIDHLKLTCPLIYSLHTCTLSNIPV